MGLKGGKKSSRKGAVQWMLVTSVDSEDTRQRTASRQQQCATTVDSGDMWQSRALKKEEGSKEREKAKENTRRREECEMGKRLGSGIRKEKGKGKGQQSMSECDECDQNDEYYSVPILLLSCGEKQK